jgi:predicted nucleic acid-binding protein
MAHLLDKGILLRLVNTQDARHVEVRQAVESLAGQQEELFTTTQNVGEFWNVATRPLADNGLALPPATAVNLLETIIEPICGILVERDTLYAELKRIGGKYAVVGKQVHDARIAAMMLVWGVPRILTLNERDFRRYAPEGIVVVTPASLAGTP